MFKKFVLAGVIIWAGFWIRSANACDPNESCNRCLASAFGHCIQRGNDPICEARKATCQVAPPIVNTPGSPFGPGGPLAPGGPIPGVSMDQVQRCVSDLAACPGQILSQIGYQTIRPIIENYIGFLQNQVGKNVQSLDEDFIADVQAFYPLDLHNVRYATNINTIHGASITIGNMIYCTHDIDLTDDDDAALAYHELQHVVQYARKGSVDSFMTEYVLNAGGSILRGGNSVDIHDNIGLEREAINKATEVAAGVASASNQTPPSFPQQGSFPQQPALGNICRIPFGGCVLPGAGPIGMGCFCGTPNGPINGIVSPN
jgi:hypothetical protein